jgi:hypothetical protein
MSPLWGLGAEHEFLTGYVEEEETGTLRVLDSKKIVLNIAKSAIDRVYHVVEAALNTPLPRLYATDPQQTYKVAIDTNLQQMYDPRSIIPLGTKDPFFGCILDKMSNLRCYEALKPLRREDLQLMLTMLAPYFTRYLDRIFLAIAPQLQEDKEVFSQIISMRFIYNASVAPYYRLVISQSDPALLLAGVLCGERFVQDYVNAASIVTLEIAGDAMLRQAHDGVYIKASMWLPVGDRIQLLVGDPAAVTDYDPAVNALLLFEGMVRLMQRQIKLDDRHDSKKLNIEYDEPFVEIKSTKFLCRTVRNIFEDLAGFKAKVMYHAAELVPPGRELFDVRCSGYVNTLFVERLVTYHTPHFQTPKYAGSYHMWFTLPYDKVRIADDLDTEYKVRFLQMHAVFAHVLQWMEPLFLSCFGGDMNAVGNGTDWPRSSIRATINPVGGVGTTGMCRIHGLITHALPAGVPIVAFRDEDALRAWLENGGSQDAPALVPMLGSKRVVLDNGNGSSSLLIGCEIVKRKPKTQLLLGRRDDQFSNVLHNLAGLPKASLTPHNQILKSQYRTKYIAQDGSDIRILQQWCDMARIRVRAGWELFLVELDAETYQLMFFNPSTGKLTRRAQVSKKKPVKNVTGFEFRFFDNMPLESAETMMNLCVLIAIAASEKYATKCDQGDVQTDVAWSQTVAEVLVRGKHAILSEEFVAKTLAILGLVALPQPPNAFEFLCRVSAALFERHRNHEWLKMMSPDCKTAPIPKDDNKECWRVGFENVLRTKLNFHETVDSFLEQKGWMACETLEELRGRVTEDLGPRWHYDVPYIFELIQDAKQKPSTSS